VGLGVKLGQGTLVEMTGSMGDEVRVDGPVGAHRVAQRSGLQPSTAPISKPRPRDPCIPGRTCRVAGDGRPLAAGELCCTYVEPRRVFVPFGS
jgi:hypothetical protein